MNGRIRRQSEAITRSNNLLLENINDFKANAVLMGKITAFGVVTGKIEQALEQQISGTGAMRQSSEVEGDARDTLKDAMEDVRDIARSIGADIVGFEKKYRVPPGNNGAIFIATARVMADEAALVQQLFLDYGIQPQTFIADLRTKADALAAAIAEHDASTETRVGGTSELEANTKSAMKLLRSIDPIVQIIYRNNPSKRAAWDFASRVERHTPVPRMPKPPTS